MTYLTDLTNDSLSGIEVHPDGAVIYAGTLHADDYGLTPSLPLGGGASGLLRLSPDGRAPLDVVRLGTRVNDVAVDQASGQVAVSGNFGVVLLDATLKKPVWQKNLGGSAGTHVAVANGVVAVGHGDAVSIFDGTGAGSVDGHLTVFRGPR